MSFLALTENVQVVHVAGKNVMLKGLSFTSMTVSYLQTPAGAIISIISSIQCWACTSSSLSLQCTHRTCEELRVRDRY